MKFFLVLIASFISFIAFSTDISLDKKTNKILKIFFNGDYYVCDKVNLSYTEKVYLVTQIQTAKK